MSTRSRVFKRRPRAFYGVRKQELATPHSTEAEEASLETDDAPVERPVPVETASSKKLAISPRYPSTGGPSGHDLRSKAQPSTSSAGEPSESHHYVGKLKGNRLVDCERFSQAVSEIGLCSTCKAPLTLREDFVSRRGLVSKLAICYTNTACNKEAVVSDPYSSESLSVNTRSVLGMREIRRGRSGLEYFCGLMDMLPPLSNRSYNMHNHKLAVASMEAAQENMNAASAHLHKLHGVGPKEVLDIVVTCDGTWSKRGYTATHGVVVVISWETGQVLDFQIQTKRCKVCSLNKLDEDSVEFAKWWEEHQEDCELNHEGSSPAMEKAGAIEIWKRSEETRHLRYTNVISDGDAKTVQALNELKPYGDEQTITKYECVGHVQKRVGTRLKAASVSVTAINREPKAKVTIAIFMHSPCFSLLAIIMTFQNNDSNK